MDDWHRGGIILLLALLSERLSTGDFGESLIRANLPLALDGYRLGCQLTD